MENTDLSIWKFAWTSHDLIWEPFPFGGPFGWHHARPDRRDELDVNGGIDEAPDWTCGCYYWVGPKARPFC